MFTYSIFFLLQKLTNKKCNRRYQSDFFQMVVALCGVCLVYVGYRLSLELLNNRLFAGLTALFFCIDGSLLVDQLHHKCFFNSLGFISLLCQSHEINEQEVHHPLRPSPRSCFLCKVERIRVLVLLILFCLQMILIQKILDSQTVPSRDYLN